MIQASLAISIAALTAVAAQADVPDFAGGVAQIISTGLVGVFLLMLIFEYGITTTKALRREEEARQRAESAKAEAERRLDVERSAHLETRTLGFETLSDVVPQATRLVDVTSRALVILEEIARKGHGA